MKKLLLFLLFVPLVNSCNSNDDFFANHQNKIWVDTAFDGFDNVNYYTEFSNGTVNTVNYGSDGIYYCETQFIGEKNNYDVNDYINSSLANFFGKDSKVNVTSAIILNKADELQIESITKSLDGSITNIALFSYKVNGDNLTITLNDNGTIDTYNASIYNGNLDINFNNCEPRIPFF